MLFSFLWCAGAGCFPSAMETNTDIGAAEDYVEGFVCTLQTCNVKEWGYVRYQPSIPGNALFLALILILAGAQLWLGIRYKIGLMEASMLLGLLTEALGYITVLWYLICLTIGPVFIAAAIYLSLGRIVVVYGEGISRIKQKTYTIIFLGCDFVSLVVQAVGGSIAASTPVTDQARIDLETNILIAGLSFQVASLFAFTACSFEFLWRVRKQPDMRNPNFSELVASKRFKWFLRSLSLATALLFIRTVFRSVEFKVLDGVMVILASACLTVCHPGYGFQERWNEAGFHFRKSSIHNSTNQKVTTSAETSGRSEKAAPKASEAQA
ncbi:hypothetical protein M011DRAFT_496645 [Sporormia fimetaria CBS 119925]|uniref:RTA1-domain-containing protein n=1 Tax=Sporormia fimetaria CBS 119925 TaxID=1340428 RepID=A0A6A6V3U4_9PLEO|nr:hypothetical protein M011DRAFT_496645 [Sporormia fimetaria CBS 119925]